MTDPAENAKNDPTPEQPEPLTRKGFLKVAATAIFGLLGAATLEGCDIPTAGRFDVPVEAMTSDRVPIPEMYPAVPYTPVEPPPSGYWRFFTPEEAQAVEAYAARLLPGTPDDPGAREAGVVYYIDNLMAHPDGFAEAVYRNPPYVETYAEDAPPEQAEGDRQVVWVSEDQIERYGYQSIYTPREVLRMSIAALNRLAIQQHNAAFAALTEQQQDAIIESMATDEAEGFEPVGAKAVFNTLRRYTMEGMFSDPVYGGNRDMVGWRLVGFPGSQRAYTPGELREEGSGLKRAPWNLEILPAFNPGQDDVTEPLLPVTGSEEHRHP